MPGDNFIEAMLRAHEALGFALLTFLGAFVQIVVMIVLILILQSGLRRIRGEHSGGGPGGSP
jgi:hypothetical protein